jgi:hypothetical protein
VTHFPFDPSPSTLWTLHLDGKVASCDLRFVPNGAQVEMLRNGALLISRIFESGEEGARLPACDGMPFVTGRRISAAGLETTPAVHARTGLWGQHRS